MNTSIGDFFKHREHGIGQITKTIEGFESQVEIQFLDRPVIVMTEALLLRTAIPVSRLGFYAFAYQKPEEALKLIDEKPVDVICLVLEDFEGYRARTEDIKDYLDKYISNWENWWKRVQVLIKNDPRIDTTSSKQREYALAFENRSIAESAYLSFRYQRNRNPLSVELVEKALFALQKYKSGELLSSERVDELNDFLKQIVLSAAISPSIRIRACFGMMEIGIVSSDEGRQMLQNMLGRNFRLYQLDRVLAGKIIDELKRGDIDSWTVSTLASGVCGSKDQTKAIIDWVNQTADPGHILQCLIVGLTENLPPDLSTEKYGDLADRLTELSDMLSSLPDQTTAWSDIMRAFQKLILSIADTYRSGITEVNLILSPLTILIIKVHQRILYSGIQAAPSIFEIITDPLMPSEFIIDLMIKISKQEPGLGKQIEERIWETIDQRNDTILQYWTTNISDDVVKQASEIVALLGRHPNPELIRMAGDFVCNLAKQADPSDLSKMLPSLNILWLSSNSMPWQDKLEDLRKTAYLGMILRPYTAGFRDPSVVQAADEAAKISIEAKVKELNDLREQLALSAQKIEDIQTLLSERDILIRELKGRSGGNVEEAQFEERSRLLRDIVSSMAEFERFTTGRAGQYKELEAMLKRLTSLITPYQVVPLEPITSRVSFNPQKHRLIDGGEVSVGDNVEVVERGYAIRDHMHKLRLLKPALVKKA